MYLHCEFLPSLFGPLPGTQCELKWSESRSVVSDSFRPHGLCSPWNYSGQNTGMGSLSLLQGIFPTQGSNPGLPHCRWILYQLSHKGSPRILEWVAYPFSSRPSRPRNHPGSPAFQADSLPTELWGKYTYHINYCVIALIKLCFILIYTYLYCPPGY